MLLFIAKETLRIVSTLNSGKCCIEDPLDSTILCPRLGELKMFPICQNFSIFVIRGVKAGGESIEESIGCIQTGHC